MQMFNPQPGQGSKWGPHNWEAKILSLRQQLSWAFHTTFTLGMLILPTYPNPPLIPCDIQLLS